MSILLGIDIGTTATKALLLDPERGVVAESDRPTRLYSPHPGWAEEEPNEWWMNVCELTREIQKGEKVEGIAVSGMVPCTILIDREGKVLRKSIQQNDARAVTEITELKDRLAGKRILERTGSSITQQSIGPNLLWLAKHEEHIFAQASTIFGSYDYITFKLTAKTSVESNWALESGLFDMETGSWAEDIIAATGMSLDLLPPIYFPGDFIGNITTEAAKSTGLQEGIPVYAGSADHVASAFASGAIDAGDMVVKLGGAGDILLVADEPLIDKRLFLDYHLIPSKYLPNGCMASSGSLIRWFHSELGSGATLEQLDVESEEAGPGAGGIIALPYFLGEKTPLNDPTARGAFIGLNLSHRRGHLFRAILEAISFGFRHHLDVFAEYGIHPKKARVTDGGTKSRIWTQVTSDILGIPLERVEIIGGSALGASFVAGIGSKKFSDWHEIERYVSVVETITPKSNPIYLENYQKYRSLYPALKNLQ